MEIKNVKFQPDSLSAEYTKKSEDGDHIHISSHASKWTFVPHPDLFEQVDRLKIIVSRAMGFSDAFIAVREIIAKKELPTIEKLEQASLEDLTITGLTISGQERKNITITAKRECHNKQVMGFTCPTIRLDTETFGFEQDVAKIVDDILAEVNAYVNENKRAQMSLDLA